MSYFVACLKDAFLLTLKINAMKQSTHSGNILLYVIMSFLFFIPFSAYAQNYQLTGSVLDGNNEPLIGANVIVAGTTNGTVTDIDGNFSLEVSPQAKLEVSYMGYIKQTIPLKGQKTIKVILKEDSQMLDETVVIGYGTMKKSDMTGAISSVNGDDLASRATTNPAEALQGKVAGVNILKSGGNAGAGIQVRIRGVKSMGSNEPLYIIDGFEGDIKTINPSDIASMEILKDGAAAAIYGSRAANGVVIVSTKTGKKGEVKVDFSAFVTFTGAAKKLEMLNAQEYLEMHDRMYQNAIDDWNSVVPDYYQKPGYLSFRDADGKVLNPTGFDTNWQDEMIGNGFAQNYNVSVRGGSDVANYSISYNHSDENGIFKGNKYVQDNARAKVNIKKYIFEFDANLGLKVTQSKQPQYSLKEMYMMSPLVPVYDKSQVSGYGLTDMEVDGVSLQLPNNRNVMADNHFVSDKVNGYDLIGNIGLTLNLAPWLKFKTAYSYNGYYENEKYHAEAYTADPKVPTKYPYNSSNNSYWYQQVFDNVLTFDKQFKKNSLTVMVGSSITAARKDNAGVGVEGKKTIYSVENGQIIGTEVPSGFADPTSPTINAGKGGTFTGDGTYWEYHRASFFGRANYSYASKYLFQATVRADGSSKFGQNNHWGVFPSVALGWRINEENFFPKNSAVSNLKLRASWGRLGNEDALGYYDYNPVMSSSNTQWLSYVQGGNPWLGYMNLYLLNNDLRWETTDTKNVGIDYGFFNNKLSGSINYYYNTTTDLLIEKVIAPSAGVYNSIVNVGKMRNTGVEFDINWSDNYRGFEYNIGFNLTTTSNKMLKADDNQVLYGTGLKYGTEHFPTQTLKGNPVASFFLYRTDGIFQTQEEADSYLDKNGNKMQPDAFAGDIKFKDVNGDGVLDENDKEYCGSGIPKVEANLSFGGSYKGIDLSFLIGSAWGNKLYNANRYNYEAMNSGSNFLKSALDAWTPEHRNTNVPRAVMDDFNGNSRESDRFLEDGDFIRLRQLQIGYTLPAKWMKKVYVDRCRFYVSGENLLTWTKYSGVDPEFSRSNILDTGVDSFIYPFTRSYVVGVQVTF